MRLLKEQLESLIDQHGLPQVLEAMAQVCYEKAEHIAVNGQDVSLAKSWMQQGKRIESSILLK